MRCDRFVNHPKKILCWHIGRNIRATTITTTMQTMDVATKSGFPKKLLQGVPMLKIAAAKTFEFKYNAFHVNKTKIISIWYLYH